MCTDRTLRNHIASFQSLSAQIKELEKLKAQESSYIMAELENRGVDRWAEVKVVNQTREYADIKRMKSAYPSIWEEVRKSISYSYLRVN